MMCGVMLKDKLSSVEVAERRSVESIQVWLRGQKFRWYGHVLGSRQNSEFCKVLTMGVPGARGRGWHGGNGA